MSFAEPSWLWMGACACALAGVCFALEARQRARALLRFVALRHAPALSASVSRPRRWTRWLLTLTGVACVFGALARPQWGHHLEKERRQGIELMFAVDTSQSMLAEDVRPSRLQRAKLAVQDLLGELPQVPVGLVAFAGDAFLQTPLTMDRSAFLQALSALDTAVIPVPGTSLQGAIRVADRGFGTNARTRKLLVLLTDGEELEGSALEAARAAASHGVRIYALGIGSLQGATIPVRDARGQLQLLRGPDGQIVHSRLDESGLRALAAVSGGRYRALQSGTPLAAALFGSELTGLGVGSVEAGVKKVPEERFQWPLAAGALLLSLAWLLGDRRRGTALPRAAVALGGMLALGASGTTAHAQAADALGTYNRAALEYKAGKFDAAAHDYHGALDTRDLSLQQRAYYDLGNAQYRQGQASKEPARQMAHYKEAIASYDAAIALRKDDADATYNRDFVRKRLQALQQQQANDGKQGSQQQQASDGKQGSQQQQASDGKQGSQQQQANDGKLGSQQQQQANGDKQGSQQQQQQQQASDGKQGSQQQQASDGKLGSQQQANDGKQGSQQQQASDGKQGTQQQQASNTQRGDDASQREPQPAGGAEHDDRSSDAHQNAQAAANNPGGAEPAQSAASGGSMRKPTAQPGAASLAQGLSRSEAAHLLDALQPELHALPSGDDSTTHARGDRPRKDW